MRRLLFIFAFVIACDVQEPLVVNPPKVDLVPHAQQVFTVAPTIPVVWSVTEPTGGTITQAGIYTAPGSNGTFHVVATSGTRSGQAVVNIDSGVDVTAPVVAETVACVPLQLTATVTGSPNGGVTWTLVDPTCGVVSPSGLFTSSRGTGDCLVVATSVVDSSKSAGTTVNVLPETVNSIEVIPTTVSLGYGQTQQFTAMVTTSCGTFPAGG